MSGTNLMTASRQWSSRPDDQRFQTVAALRESVEGRRVMSRTRDMTIKGVSVVAENDTLLINGMEPSHWAFGQVASQLGAPASYLRGLSTTLAASCLSEGIDKAQDLPVKVMWHRFDDGKSNLMASTSQSYGRIWDADVVAAVQRVQEKDSRWHNPLAYPKGQFGSGEPVPSGLYASDHDVFCFLIDGGSLLEAGPRAQLNRGFIVWNSEVGSRTFGLMGFYFNVVCGNHIIWDATGITKLVIRHCKGGPGKFAEEALPMLRRHAESSSKPEVEAVHRAMGMDLLLLVGTQKMDEEFVCEFARRFKFSRGEVREAIETAQREEGKCRFLWDIVQGFTAAARDIPHADTRVDLEIRAGRLLDLVK